MSARRLSAGQLVVAATLLALAPLLLLAYLSVSRASDAVRDQATGQVRSTATVGALLVQTEMQALGELVNSYAQGQSLVEALRAGDRRATRVQLGELAPSRPGVAVAFVTRSDGVLVDTVPPTPSVIGKDFSFRDWFHGVVRTGGPYVSEAYATQARGHARVVAASAFVRDPATGRQLGILVAGFSLDHIQQFVERFADTQHVRLTVTDQRGVLLAGPGTAAGGLVSRRSDPRVAAGLAGRAGTLERNGRLSAYTPVADLGWTVTASVSKHRALAPIRDLRTTVYTIASLLALVLLCGLAFLARVLRGRERAERASEESRRALARQNEELASQQVELEAQQVELESQQEELQVVLGDLVEDRGRLAAFSEFTEMVTAELDLDVLARKGLRALAEFAAADVGSLYAVGHEGENVPRLVVAHGLAPDRLPAMLAPGDGFAGRALVERRPVPAAYGQGGLKLSVLGEDVALHHEVHLPLLQGERVLGVISLGRFGDSPFLDADLVTYEHLADQIAVALSRALALRRALQLASVNRAVLDATVDALLLVDVDGLRLVANTAFDRMPGAAKQFTGDVSIYDLARETAPLTREPDGYLAMFAAIAADQERVSLDEFELVDTRTWMQQYTAPVHDESGELIGRIFSIRDISVQRAAEQLKTDLVATVSHELRTPLTSVLGYSELLLARDPGPEARERYLRAINTEGARLTNLINDFLDIQRMEEDAGFTVIQRPVDVNALIHASVDVFSAQSAEHTLVVSISDGPPLLALAEADWVTQVLANLLSNAIKYSPNGGNVEVACAPHDGFLRVSVRDYGLGIPADQQTKIFTKFFRVDTRDTREIGGTGLGLAICNEIVKAHGGTMGFDSVMGEGSTFWFELPLVHRHRLGGSVPRVLVIEDDPAVAALLAGVLGESYEVEVVATGEDGLELARREPPALICLDIELPGELDGWQVLEQLKAGAGTSDVPVVICTSGNGRDRAGVLGAADFLVKPFSQHRLVTAIERLVPDRGSVLVADDDAGLRALVSETLRASGHNVREAANGRETLAAIEARRPDLLVLDLMMPEPDGLQILELLQQSPETRDLPVLVVSGKDLHADERRVLSNRVVALLDKVSFAPEQLLEIVDRALGAEPASRRAA